MKMALKINGHNTLQKWINSENEIKKSNAALISNEVVMPIEIANI